MAGVPGQPRGAVPQGVERGRAVRRPRAAHHPAGAGPGDGRAEPGRRGTRRSTWWPAGCAALRAERGADAVAVFGGGGLTNEKAYQLGKLARVALGTSPDRLQRPLVHVVGGVRRDAGLRPGPGAAVPAGRRRAGRRASSSSAPTWPRPCRRPRATSTRSAPAAARSSSSTRGVRRPRTAPTSSCSRSRAPTSPWRSACCTCSSRAGRSTRSTSPPAPPAGRRSASRSPAGGPSGSSGSPACRPTRCGRWRTLLAGKPRVMVLTARGAEQHSTGLRHRARLDQRGPRARDAGHAVRRLRLPHRAGQRPGRARARPEGRPAARLPDDRRPGRARARRRRVGRRPGLAARARGARRTSCSTRSGSPAARRRCWSSAPTSSSPRPAPRTSPSGWSRSTCSWSPTWCSPRPRRWPTWSCRSPSGPRRPAP